MGENKAQKHTGRRKTWEAEEEGEGGGQDLKGVGAQTDLLCFLLSGTLKPLCRRVCVCVCVLALPLTRGRTT